MIFCWSSLKNLLPFQYFYLCGLVKVWSDVCHSSTEVSAPVNWDNHTKVCVLFMMSPELFCSFHAFLLHFSHVQSKTRQICWLPICKSQMALNLYSNRHQLRSIIECCGCRTPQIDSEDGDTKSPTDRKLYILQLSVLVVNLETFGYTFIWWMAQIMKVFAAQYSPATCHFLPPRYTHSSLPLFSHTFSLCSASLFYKCFNYADN
jgi:hypothetical protein